MRILPRLAALFVLSSVLTGCGIAFGSASEGTEFFKSLDVSGEKTAGAPLTATILYAQKNPLPVLIRCELRQNKEAVKQIGEATAPALVYGRPDLPGVPGTFAFDFVVDAPGAYRVQCFTVLEEDNFIEEKITIAGEPPVPTITPLP